MVATGAVLEAIPTAGTRQNKPDMLASNFLRIVIVDSLYKMEIYTWIHCCPVYSNRYARDRISRSAFLETPVDP